MSHTRTRDGRIQSRQMARAHTSTRTRFDAPPKKTERALDISISAFWFLDFCIAAAIYSKKKKHERRTKQIRSARFWLFAVACRVLGDWTSPAAVSTSPAPSNPQIPKHDRSIGSIGAVRITNQSTKPTPSPLGPALLLPSSVRRPIRPSSTRRPLLGRLDSLHATT